MVEYVAPGSRGPKGDPGVPGPPGPAGAAADMTRVAALEAAVASLILSVSALQAGSGKLSAGQSAVAALRPGEQSTVSVMLRPVQADTGFTAVAWVAGGADAVDGLSVVSTRVLSGGRVDVVVKADGVRSVAGAVLVLAVRP